MLKRIACLLLIIVSIGILFGGAVSAATVTTTVTDENGDPVNTDDNHATVGDEVTTEVDVSTDQDTTISPQVEVTTDPDTSLQYEPEKAIMSDGVNDYTNDPNNNPFFYYDDTNGVWVWDIGAANPAWGQPGDAATLLAPAIVKAAGTIAVSSDFTALDPDETRYSADSDSYDFTADPAPTNVEPANNTNVTVNGETIPMKETGGSLAALLAGFLTALSGFGISRLKY